MLRGSGRNRLAEYQYFEFLAVDRSLTDREMAELRAVSPRAEITPTRFASEAGFSNFRGDLRALMTWYFDVMVHVTSWGTRRFMLRLPAALVDAPALQACFAGKSASMHLADLRWPKIPPAGPPLQLVGNPAPRADRDPHAPHRNGTDPHLLVDEVVVLDFHNETDHPEDWQDGEGWMASLAPLRADLLHGDMRAAYLGWLLCAQRGEVEEDALEPPVPPGLGKLPEPLGRLVDFLSLDEHLLAAAAAGSARRGGQHMGLTGWIASLPRREKDELLLTVARGREAHVGARLLKRFRSSHAAGNARAEATGAPARTAGGLLEMARLREQEHAREQARRAAEARAQREAEQAAGRTKHLDELAHRQEAAWGDIEGLIAIKQPMTYDLAVVLINDLRDIAVRTDTQPQFEARLAALRERHRGKPSFLDRLKQAGLEPRRQERAS